jgi:uncharacterized membrane protein YbhN (UPF0104 family)
MRTQVKQVGKVVISGGLCVVAVAVVGPHRVLAAFGDIDASSLVTASLLVAVSMTLLMVRWIVMVRPDAPAPIATHVRVYLYANFLNSFTPANVGGDVYRLARLRSAASRPAALLECILRERVLGMLAYLVGLTLVVPLWSASARDIPPVYWMAAAAALLGAAAILLLPRVIPVIARWAPLRERPRLARVVAFVYRVSLLDHGPGRVALVLLSMLSWLAWVCAVAVVGHGLGLGLGLPAVAAIATLTELARLIPLTFQGVGVRESTFALLVGIAGAAPGTGFAVATVAYLLLTLALLASGPLSWLVGLLPSARPRTDEDLGQGAPPSTESKASST